MLTQGYDGKTWNYDYNNGSYELSRVLGTIALDSTRNASRANNFVYDASGRMVADSSKNLTVEYNPNGMPVKFVQSTGSSTWQELMLYDPSGWRVATLDYENNTLQMLRTNIMAGGQKVLERRKVYVGNDSSVAEYKMIRGRSGIVGRVLPNSSKEWYVKDYQGSLVMTLLNDETGNVFVYEPYGAQTKVKVTGDSPAEQYTGKEYNERLGLYYYGARFYDPILGVWISPDAARQFNNPFHFGGDPVNYLDPDGNNPVLGIAIAIAPWIPVIVIGVPMVIDFVVSAVDGYYHGFGPGFDGSMTPGGLAGSALGSSVQNIVNPENPVTSPLTMANDFGQTMVAGGNWAMQKGSDAVQWGMQTGSDIMQWGMQTGGTLYNGMADAAYSSTYGSIPSSVAAPMSNGGGSLKLGGGMMISTSSGSVNNSYASYSNDFFANMEMPSINVQDRIEKMGQIADSWDERLKEFDFSNNIEIPKVDMDGLKNIVDNVTARPNIDVESIINPDISKPNIPNITTPNVDIEIPKVETPKVETPNIEDIINGVIQDVKDAQEINGITGGSSNPYTPNTFTPDITIHNIELPKFNY